MYSYIELCIYIYICLISGRLGPPAPRRISRGGILRSGLGALTAGRGWTRSDVCTKLPSRVFPYRSPLAARKPEPVSLAAHSPSRLRERHFVWPPGRLAVGPKFNRKE